MTRTEREPVQQVAVDSTGNAGATTSSRAQLVAALAIILLLASGAGAFAWYEWKYHRRPTEQLVDVSTPRIMNWTAGPRAAPIRTRPPIDPNALQETFHAGNARLHVIRNSTLPTTHPSAAQWRFNFAFVPSLVTPEQALLLTARMNSLVLQLTPEQVRLLDAVKQSPDEMVVTNDDREKVRALWNIYSSAPSAERVSRANDITTALADIEKRSEPATRREIAAGIEKVKTILTPDQVAKLAKK